MSSRSIIARSALFSALALVVALGVACKRSSPERAGSDRSASERAGSERPGRKILRTALRAKVGTLDPVRCSSQYDNAVVSAIYEPLLQYRYGVRPYALEPNLLAAMPEVSDDQLDYTFTLKPGVLFQDDPAFPEGRGRELVASDVVYSIKRMANHELAPSGWWIYAGHIRGLDAFKAADEARAAGTPFAADAPVEGLEVLDRHRFRVRLVRPFPQLLHVLATCYASIVPREAAERYGVDLGRHPVGTGPFRLKELAPGTHVVLEKNARYRDPQLPKADEVVMRVFEQDQPMWLAFRAGELDFVQTPSAFFSSAFDEKNQLRPSFVAEGWSASAHAKLDFIYRGFDMDDPVTGGFERGKKVRQAIALALDSSELADAFYDRTAVPYDGPIPPGLEGHAPGKISPYRGPDLARAKALLAEAGYPEGKGLPPIQYHTNRGGNAPEQAEMLKRQLAKVGVELAVSLHSFPELDELVKKGKAQMFQLSWGSDYPDAENNLALFYGANRRPGSNVFAYARPEYDALYERARVLPSSPERTRLYEQMRDLIIEDAPAIAGLARTRYYVWHRRVHDLSPDETWFGWIKWVDVDPLE